MKSRPLLLVVAVLALAALGWFLTREDPGPAPQPRDDVGRMAGDGGARGADEVELAGTTTTAREQAPVASAAPPSTADPVTVAADDHRWGEQLAGLTGRIVEEDGAPVGGITVELYEADLESLITPEHRSVGTGLCLGKGRSGEDGRFTIRGARGSGFHALSLDPAGARSTVRVLDTSLAFGAVKDVGDIVLAAGGTVTGTVVDEDGEPVAGARVRFAAVPEVVVQSGALEVRADTLVVVTVGEQAVVVDPRAEFMAVTERLPAATGFTDAEGRFRLVGAAAGRLVGGADHPGHVGGAIAGFQLDAGAEVDVGEVELLFGREITGKVTDSGGVPVEGAEVRVGALSPVLPAGLLQPGAVTGADGTFAIGGVPEEGKVVVAARRGPRERWTVAQGSGISASVDVVLAAQPDLMVEVRGPDDAPVQGATLALAALPPAERGNGMASMGGELSVLSDWHPARVAAEEVEPGRYRIAALTEGRYLVEASGPGHGAAWVQHDHGAGAGPATIRCEEAWHVVVRCVDAATGAPVEDVHAALLDSDGQMFGAVASAWSDAEGLARVGPLGVTRRPEVGFRGPFEGWLLRMEHPRYALETLTVDRKGLPEDGPLIVEMRAPASIAGRVSWNGGAPGSRYMINVQRRHTDFDNDLQLPSLAVTDAEGNYRVDGLPPGSYTVELYERFLDRDPLEFLEGDVNPRDLAGVELELAPAEEGRADFALLADGAVAPGWFEGRVRLNGQPPVNAHVVLGWNDELRVPLDGNGEFRTQELDASDRTRITIVAETGEGESTEEMTLYQDYRRPLSGRATRIDVDVRSRRVVLTVIDAETLAPIAGATVGVEANETTQGSSTDDEGRATLTVAGAGTSVQAWASAHGYVETRRAFPAGADEPVRVELRMVRAVPCKGSVVLPPDVSFDPDEGLWMMIGDAADSDWGGEWTQIQGDMGFDADNVSPGTKRAHLWTDGGLRRVTFEVPPGGSDTIVIDFREE